MMISHIKLRNWRNFQKVDADLGNRVFLVGPNACGKSNFLDVFRFLRDIAKGGGGLQQAVQERGGFSKIRCLSARREPDIEIEIHLAENPGTEVLWKYSIGMKQEVRGYRKVYLAYEKVWRGQELILDRPDDADKQDRERLTQTHIEQISANARFRELAKFLESVLYLHLVPQLLRYPGAFTGPGIPGDPFGSNFLERVTKTQKRTRNKRLGLIEKALMKAVPQLKNLKNVRDEMGIPHLEAVYEHWRPQGAKQREDQFSDGTLRLMALLWSLLESNRLLLLEEPELSLHSAIVRDIPVLIYRLQKKKNQQVIVSTHSAELLSDKGIGAEEILVFTPDPEGTIVRTGVSIKGIKELLDNGWTIGESIIPKTIHSAYQQGTFFDIR